MLKKRDLFYIFIAIFVFWTILFIKNRSIFYYAFDKDLIDSYLHSQDITDRVEGRVFISDSDIYITSGYLYAQGEDPVKYNFQHPPLIKYLYGWSIGLSGNPFFVQIIFSGLLIFMVYSLGVAAT